jgi:hypothetical protein
VERVEPATVEGVQLGMEALANLASPAEAREALARFPIGYASWIDAQALPPSSEARRREVAEELIQRARFAKSRLETGLAELDDPLVFEAFRIANRAMAALGRHLKTGQWSTSQNRPMGARTLSA